MNTLPRPPKTINPLWIIFLFFSFAEATLGVAAFKTTGGVQITLTAFVVIFPVLIAAAFFVVLWFRPEHLYAPRDYGSDESFLRSMADARNGRGAEFTTFAAELKQTVQKTLLSPQVAERLSALKGEDLLQEAVRISDDIQQSSFIRVELSSISPKVSALMLPVAALRNVDSLMNEVYFAIADFVRPYAYGYDWILRDAKSKKVIENRRMLTLEPAGKPCSDSRSLFDIGIIPGMTLEAVRP